MPIPPNSVTRLRFAEFEIDLRTGEVLAKGRRSVLSEKPLQLLAALLETPGELVTREELKRRLWGSDTFVDFDLSLNKAMNRLREALGDSAEQPLYVETLPKRGYRFIGAIDGTERQTEEWIAPPTSSPSSEKGTVNRRPFKLLLGTAVALSISLIIAVGIRERSRRAFFPRMRQLTANSSEVPIRTAAISPDGKYLAFSDIRGL